MIETIKEKALREDVPIIKDDGLIFMLNLIKERNIKDILELGTAVGYSAINMAKLGKDIHIDTLEKNEDMFHQAITNIKNEGLDGQIRVHYGPIEEFKTDKKYDLIFVDAAKAQYGKYTEQFLDNLKDDGIFLYDNMIFHGMVYHADTIKNKGTRSLVKKLISFHEKMKNDSRFDIMFYEDVGDGLLVATRRKSLEQNNIAFLGFITAAADYLKDNVAGESDEIKTINDINLDAVKSELNKKLSNRSFTSDHEKLFDLGKEYFAEYIKNSEGDLIDEFEDIFNVNFKKENEVNDENVTKHLMELLSKSSTKQSRKNEFGDADRRTNEYMDIISKAVNGEEDLDQIFDEASNREDNTPADEKEMDDLFAEIVDHEDDSKGEPFSKTNFNNNQRVNNKSVKNNRSDEINFDEFYCGEELYRDRPIEGIYITNPAFYDDGEDVSLETDIAALEDASKEHQAQEAPVIEKPQVEVKPKTEEAKNPGDYVDELLDDLKAEDVTKQIEEKRAKEEADRNKVYDAIKKVYPYLSVGFINGVYDLKSSLANDYPNGADIIILHRLRFKTVDGLEKFAEVVLAHEYFVNADEDQMIIDTFKEHTNSEGVILNDIFSIANQAKLLTGEYEGYRVIINEKN